MKPYLYWVSSPDEDRELAYLEASRMLGERVFEPYHFADTLIDITESAYIKLCGKCLLFATGFEDLLEKIKKMEADCDRFRIEIYSSIRTRKDLPSNIEAVIAVANAIQHGNPDLNHPQTYLDIVANEKGYYFLLRMYMASNSWRAHIKKPYSFSSSLSARHSRALVNIAGVKAKTFLDPCCGFGNVAIEAAYLGYQVEANDWNEKQVGYAKENAKHFGFQFPICCKDALTLLPQGRVDAIVVDFPYGINSLASENFYIDFIRYYFARTKTLVTLTTSPFEESLIAEGYQVLGVARPYKNQFMRYVTVSITK